MLSPMGLLLSNFVRAHENVSARGPLPPERGPAVSRSGGRQHQRFATHTRCANMRRRATPYVAVIVMLVAGSPRESQAQAVVAIDASKGPACAGCEIVLTRVASLGSLKDAETPGFYSGVAMDSRGRVFVTGRETRSIVVYDTEGRFIRVFGRPGGGPGEFRQVVALGVGPGDSVVTVDGPRVSVFSPALEFVRSFVTSAPGLPIEMPVAFPDGTIALVLPPARAGVRAQPVHVFTPGEIAPRVLGLSAPGSATQCLACEHRVIGASQTPGHLWLAPVNTFAAELWTAAGTRSLRVEMRGAHWFEPWTSDPVRGADVRPRNTITRVVEDTQRRVWVAAKTTIDRWTPPPAGSERGRAATGRSGSTVSFNDMNPSPELLKRSATVVEVLDPVAGRIVVSQRFDGRAIRLLTPEFAAEFREDRDGVAVLDLYRMSIRAR
jgi:hypothetical protein